jgi:hypothetical protein
LTRRAVTQAHDRTAIEEMAADRTGHFAADPGAVLRHVGSRHAPASHDDHARKWWI